MDSFNNIYELNQEREDMSFLIFDESYIQEIERINAIETQKVKKILDDAIEKNIVLNLNEKGKNEWYPLLYATYMDNIEMAKLLIEYANKNDIVLEINKKNNDGYNPLLWAIERNKIKIVQLLIDYARKKNCFGNK